MNWILIVILIILAVNIILILTLCGVIYTILLVRNKPEKWGRNPSMPDDPEYVAMYQEGIKWGDKYFPHRRELRIHNDGFSLAAQYFDFGSNKAVIIIPGRMECCRYSYYYAEPYRAAGYNVLCIDTRAHGLSEGRVSSLGYKEYRDIIAWSEFLHNSLGIEDIVLHGLCIGSSTALFTLTSESCPQYISAMVGDGMYVNFKETLRNHMIEQGRPMVPFFAIILAYIRIISGANVVSDGPLKRIPALKKPILFIHSRMDIYSLPEKAEELYAACGSEDKRIEWFDNGGHSRVRFNSPEKYDAAIQDFLNFLNGKATTNFVCSSGSTGKVNIL